LNTHTDKPTKGKDFSGKWILKEQEWLRAFRELSTFLYCYCITALNHVTLVYIKHYNTSFVNDIYMIWWHLLACLDSHCSALNLSAWHTCKSRHLFCSLHLWLN
jgi:hypothetical protein